VIAHNLKVNLINSFIFNQIIITNLVSIKLILMKSNFKSSILILSFFIYSGLQSQSFSPFDLNSDWTAKIKSTVSEFEKIKLSKPKKVLIFSLHTGFKHWTIPHTEAVMKIIAEDAGGFEVTLSKDIFDFEKDRLSEFDVVILNNNCSIGPGRNMFLDVLKDDSLMDEESKQKKASQLERNLIRYIEKGKGLMVLHGGIVMQNNSIDFSGMVGGSFDFHPAQQELHLKLHDPNHPLVSGFDPKGFVHYDEPYFFKNAYYRYDFRPLLYIELDEIKMKRERPSDKIKYVSWIKRHGRGRVFYSSPSHNAQSYEQPELLAFLQKGLLYAAGLLDCDDSPIGLNR